MTRNHTRSDDPQRTRRQFLSTAAGAPIAVSMVAQLEDCSTITPSDDPAKVGLEDVEQRLGTSENDGRTATEQEDPDEESETATAEEALEAKEQATARLEELEELDATDEVDVDDTLIQSIEDDLEAGDGYLQAEEYADAVAHYEKAKEQARAGLIRGYQHRAELLLNASESNLQERKDLGYTDPEVHVIEERIAEDRADLEDADDLAAARTVHEHSIEISDDVESLPQPWLIRIVNAVTSLWALVVGVVLLGGGTLGAWIRRNGEEEAEENDPDLT